MQGWFMPRTANPYTKVAKRIALLQTKANKLNAEIAALAEFVASESQKTTKPTTKKASATKAKKTSVKPKTTPKKAPKAKSPKK